MVTNLKKTTCLVLAFILLGSQALATDIPLKSQGATPIKNNVIGTMESQPLQSMHTMLDNSIHSMSELRNTVVGELKAYFKVAHETTAEVVQTANKWTTDQTPEAKAQLQYVAAQNLEACYASCMSLSGLADTVKKSSANFVQKLQEQKAQIQRQEAVALAKRDSFLATLSKLKKLALRAKNLIPIGGSTADLTTKQREALWGLRNDYQVVGRSVQIYEQQVTNLQHVTHALTLNEQSIENLKARVRNISNAAAGQALNIAALAEGLKIGIGSEVAMDTFNQIGELTTAINEFGETFSDMDTSLDHLTQAMVQVGGIIVPHGLAPTNRSNDELDKWLADLSSRNTKTMAAQ